MPFQERFLAAGGEDAVHRLAGVGQAQAEQAQDHTLPSQAHGHVSEVDLGLLAGSVRLRHEHLGTADSGLGPDLAPAHRDVGADHSVGDAVRVMLIEQPVEDALGGVTLLARRVQVRPQHLIHQRLERIDPGRPRRELLPRLRPRGLQCLLHRGMTDPVLAHQGAFAQPGMMVTADRRVQIGPRLRSHRRPPVTWSNPHAPTASPRVLLELINTVPRELLVLSALNDTRCWNSSTYSAVTPSAVAGRIAEAITLRRITCLCPPVLPTPRKS